MSNSEDASAGSKDEEGKTWESDYDDSDKLYSPDEDSDYEVSDVDRIPEAFNKVVKEKLRLGRKKGLQFQNIQFDPKTKRKNIEFKVGMKFSNKEEFKNAVRDYGIGHGRKLKYKVNAGTRFHLICEDKCPWDLWVSKVQGSGMLQVKSLCNKHTCTRVFKNKLGNTKFLADFYGERIRKCPEWKLVNIQRDIRTKLKLDVTLTKCFRVRQRALSNIQELLVKHYERVWDYAHHLKKSNPGNTVEVLVNRDNPEGKPQFQRSMYVLKL